MSELENKEEQERVLVPVRKHEQKTKQELSEKTLEAEEQRGMPRRWHTY